MCTRRASTGTGGMVARNALRPICLFINMPHIIATSQPRHRIVVAVPAAA